MSEFCPYTYNVRPAKLKYPSTFPMPSEKERDKRWQAIRKSMSKHKFDCLIVCAPYGYMPSLNNYLYYVSNYVPYCSLGDYIVFPLTGEPQLVVNNSIGPQFMHVAMATSWINDVVGSLYPAQVIIGKINQLNLQSGRVGITGYKAGIFSAAVYTALREAFPTAHFEDASAALSEAMNEVSRSSEEELTLLLKACEILDESYKAVAEIFKPGVKEYELWAAAEHAIIKNGGWNAQSMYVTSGPNPSFPKAPAAHNTLSQGDVAIFEINATYGGVTPQICFAISLGKPNKEVEKMFDLCDQLYHFSLAELEKKRTFMDIEQDLAEQIHKAGYEPMTPQIHRYNMAFAMPMDITPQPGDYFTVHPNMCNKDFTAGAKFGDSVRITKEGKVVRLHKTPAKLNIF